jgi:hypothetical protein
MTRVASHGFILGPLLLLAAPVAGCDSGTKTPAIRDAATVDDGAVEDGGSGDAAVEVQETEVVSVELDGDASFRVLENAERGLRTELLVESPEPYLAVFQRYGGQKPSEYYEALTEDDAPEALLEAESRWPAQDFSAGLEPLAAECTPTLVDNGTHWVLVCKDCSGMGPCNFSICDPHWGSCIPL